MSAAHLATVPTRQQLAAQGRTLPGKVTGKLKAALHAMVWLGMKRADAAKHAGLKEQSLYVALSRPHVRTAYLHQLEVLRTSERARNIHTLCEVRDDPANKMARVQAVKVLEQLDDEVTTRRGSGFSAAPGFIINIINAPAVGPTGAIGVHDVERPAISTVSVPSLGERRGEDDE